MRPPSRETVELLRREYPAGTRVELVTMDDPQAPPAGTRGTCRGVDDAGSILVSWDNGCGLSLAYGADEARKLDAVTTVCYGNRKVWDSRKEAIDFFLKAMDASEGAERGRYEAVHSQLTRGCATCSDGA